MTLIKLGVRTGDETPSGNQSLPKWAELGNALQTTSRADLRYNCQVAYGSFTRLRRSAFVTTETDDKLIAAAAMMGLSSQPNAG